MHDPEALGGRMSREEFLISSLLKSQQITSCKVNSGMNKGEIWYAAIKASHTKFSYREKYTVTPDVKKGEPKIRGISFQMLRK